MADQQHLESIPRFLDRDLSWLCFNERVLMEAANGKVPLLERLNFLSIYSSNLDEFFRVRMPVIAAVYNLRNKKKVVKEMGASSCEPDEVRSVIQQQLVSFGRILNVLLTELQKEEIHVLYGQEIPAGMNKIIAQYFFAHVLGHLVFVDLSLPDTDFFPENNKLYIAFHAGDTNGMESFLVVNIPSGVSRFFSVKFNDTNYVLFLDDIIKSMLPVILGEKITDCFSFKVTRDAELNLADVYGEGLAERIEREIAKRDYGLATRLLYEPGVSPVILDRLTAIIGLERSVIMEGGRYHNLKDLSQIRPPRADLRYKIQDPILHPFLGESLMLDTILKKDILLHPPYHSYDPVLRLFNEAAVLPDVTHIFVTMYRVAGDSAILNALLSAVANHKKVTVLIELKARFDEENNLNWAKRLKKAGAEVIFTPKELKVHAKVALIKRKIGDRKMNVGLLATGNLNERTARFYTDHVLLTSHAPTVAELEIMFKSFRSREKKVAFRNLLVARFNLQERLLEMIDNEIYTARRGGIGKIILKLNNLEEQVLINKLYEASNAAVAIELLVRGICCLIPGVVGLSENIRVRRIVDRYLEHGRIYYFYNGGNEDVYLGSADWMNRNIYRRIEVCFPLHDPQLKAEMIDIIKIQLRDNVQAVELDGSFTNRYLTSDAEPIQSQEEIYRYLAMKAN